MLQVGSVVVARGLQITGSAVVAMGLVAQKHVRYSWTRDWTDTPVSQGGILITASPGKPHAVDSLTKSIHLCHIQNDGP